MNLIPFRLRVRIRETADFPIRKGHAIGVATNAIIIQTHSSLSSVVIFFHFCIFKPISVSCFVHFEKSNEKTCLAVVFYEDVWKPVLLLRHSE